MDSLRGGATELVNTNKLVRFYKGTTGLKTGTTAKAGCCVSASAKRGNTHLIAVVMGSQTSDDRFNGAKAMLNWGFANYSTVTPRIDPSLITDVAVIGGVADYVHPALPKAASVWQKSMPNKPKRTLPVSRGCLMTNSSATKNTKRGK